MQEIVNRNYRIARRLVLYAVLFSSVITLLTSAFQLYNGFVRDVGAIENRLHEIRTIHLNNIASRMWVSDLSELKNQLKSILQLPEMQFIEVMEKKKSLLTLGQQQQDGVITESYPVYYHHRGLSQRIGTLKVQATLRNVYRDMWHRMWEILISNAIKTFFVAGFIVFLFYRMVTRHLEKIAEYAESLQIDNLDAHLQLQRGGGADQPDELDTLVAALSSMQQNLLQSINEHQKSEKKFRLLLDCTGESVMGIDKNGYCTFVNPACLKALGYNIETELLDKNMHESGHFSVSESDRKQHKIFKVSETGIGIQVSNEIFFDKNANPLPVDYHAFPVRNNETIEGIVVTFMDISKRRKIEQELNVYRTQLEEKVNERTMELSESNKELEAFCYTVSHDLRAPLRGINGFSKILVDDCGNLLSEEGKSHLGRIQNAVIKMDTMINNLLSLSRKSREPICCQQVNLSQLVKKRVGQLRQEESDRQVNLTIRDKLVVNADKNLITEVITNLIDNAWKYTMLKSDATIEFGQQVIDGRAVYFVKDNGVGFDMRHADKLFTVFQRLHKPGEFAGNGVGLAIVHRIITRHGGKIWADAEPGYGAVFYFELPESIVKREKECA